jgi:hypothetical protein
LEKLFAVGFTPPYVIGLDGEFNTFRLSTLFAKNCKAGDLVYLMDEKSRLVFGIAEVVGITKMPLGEACVVHAAKNHTQKGLDPTDAPARLYAIVQKIYGPHIATPEKACIVIDLKRLE